MGFLQKGKYLIFKEISRVMPKIFIPENDNSKM